MRIGGTLMYKVSLRLNFCGISHHSTSKCDLPQEALVWINKNIGIFGPISGRNTERIMDMLPGEKVKFKVPGIYSVSVTYK